jgi:hypothetical protein
VLSMTDRDVVERARTVAGVGPPVRVRPTTKLYPGRGWKEQWTWCVQQNEEAMALAWAIFPWLGERRQQQVRQLFETWRTNGGLYGRRMPFDASSSTSAAS